MAYERTYWEDSPSTATIITAERLNNIEVGIEDAHNAIAEIEAELKVDYKEILGAGDLNHLLGDNGSSTGVIIYNILGVEGLAHAPIDGIIYGYMTVSRQEHDTHIWVEQTIYLPHKIYHRRYTVDTKYTDTGSWSEWQKLATTADTYNRSEVNAMIADLQEQIDNIDTSGSLPNGDEVSY